MYKIAICDDDEKYIHELREMILEENGMKREIVFYDFQSGEELLSSEMDEIDAIFLDIQMENMNGNEIAIKLKEQEYQGLLIQCSGIFMPTPETVKISPYRYFLKQYSYEETLRELEEVFEELDRRKACYEIEGFYKRERVRIRLADIVYISHYRNGSSVVHLNQKKAENYMDGKILVHANFDELSHQLEAADFAIPHNSYMVNLRYITGLNPQEDCIEADGVCITVSRGKREEFFRKLAEYSRNKYRKK